MPPQQQQVTDQDREAAKILRRMLQAQDRLDELSKTNVPQGYALVRETPDGGKIYRKPDGQLTFTSSGYATNNQAEIQRMIQGMMPAQARRTETNKQIVEQDGVRGAAVSAIKGIPFVGEYFDEAMGMVTGDPRTTAALRETANAYQEQRPLETFGLQAGLGTAATLPFVPLQAVGNALKAAPSMTRAVLGGMGVGAGAGAVEGAVSGFGAGEGTAQQRLPNAQTGAVIGGALGGTIGAAAAPVEAGIRNVLQSKEMQNWLKSVPADVIGAGLGTVAGGTLNLTDANGDGVIDDADRMLNAAGGAITGAIGGRLLRGGKGGPSSDVDAQGFGGGSVSMRSYAQAAPEELDDWFKSEVEQVATNSNRTTLRLKSSPETQSGTLRKLNDVHINFQNEGAGLAVDMTFRGGYSAAKYTANPKDVAAATRVFAKTLAAINVYVRKNNPGYITFIGASEAHNRLYQKLMERANIKGYTAIKDVSSSSYMNKNAATGEVIGSTTPRPYERFMLIKDEELANFQKRRPGPVTAFSYPTVGPDGSPVIAVSKSYAERRPVR